TLLYGANAALIETLGDAAAAAEHLGENLAVRDDLDRNDAEVRIYGAVRATVHLIAAWTDPASEGQIINPRLVEGGALTWATLLPHAAWAAYHRAASDPKRLAAFKAIDAKFQKKQRT